MQHEPSLDTWTTLFLLIAAQGFFLSLLLLRKRTTDSMIIGFVCLLFSLMMTAYVAFWTKYLLVLPRFVSVSFGFIYLIAPLIYFHVRAMRWRQIRSEWFHLLPFAMFLILRVFGQGTALVVLQNLHLLLYSVLICKQNRWPETWPFLGFAAAFHVYYALLFTGLLIPESDYMVSFAMAIFIYYHGFKLVVKPGRTSPEVTSAHRALFSRISSQILNEKLFLDGALSLGKLAHRTGFSYHQLSEAINLVSGKNYNDFLNDFRISEAQRLLLQHDLSVINVAYATGFNNKVSFFKAFRKATGMTPGEWQRKKKNTGGVLG